MNDTTLFLSQLIGPVLILLALSMLMRQESWKAFIKGMGRDSSLLLYNGILESTAGLAIVLHHNLWSTPAEVIISLLGWAMILEGAFDLFISKRTIKQAVKSMSDQMMKLSGIFMLVIGAYLTWFGFLA